MPVFDIETALKLADRREALCRLQLECPGCGTRQVQLINGDFVPAHWECRECKARFEEG